jgi:hypothetical protein
MTEAEWHASGDPLLMMDSLKGRVSDRKLRLFACACVRSGWHVLHDDRHRQAVEATEAYADGIGKKSDLKAVRLAVTAARRDLRVRLNGTSTHPHDFSEHELSYAVSDLASEQNFLRVVNEVLFGMEPHTLLRDIVGNPFRPVAFDPRWRSADAVGLARGIYDERAFDRLPLLADALMDAGCDHEQVLGHCRSEGPHVRGCWVVDLVLGKA